MMEPEAVGVTDHVVNFPPRNGQLLAARRVWLADASRPATAKSTPETVKSVSCSLSGAAQIPTVVSREDKRRIVHQPAPAKRSRHVRNERVHRGCCGGEGSAAFVGDACEFVHEGVRRAQRRVHIAADETTTQIRQTVIAQPEWD